MTRVRVGKNLARTFARLGDGDGCSEDEEGGGGDRFEAVRRVETMAKRTEGLLQKWIDQIRSDSSR